MPKTSTIKPNQPGGDPPPPQTTDNPPSEDDTFYVERRFTEICITYGVLIEAQHKRTNSINFYEKHEAQNQLPQNLRFKLAMNNWPICFEQDKAHAIHLQEVKLLDATLMQIAENRKNVLILDLRSIINRLTTLNDPEYFTDHLITDRPSLEGCTTYHKATTARYTEFLKNFDREKHNLQFRNQDRDDNHEATSHSEITPNLAPDSHDLQIPPGSATAASTTTQNKKQKRLKTNLAIPLIEKSNTSGSVSTISHAEISNNSAIPLPKQLEITTEQKLETISTQVQGLITAMAQKQQNHQQPTNNKPFYKKPFSYGQSQNYYSNQQATGHSFQGQQQHHEQSFQNPNHWQEQNNTGMNFTHPSSFNNNPHIEYSNNSNGQYRQANHTPSYSPHPPNTPAYYNNNKRPY